MNLNRQCHIIPSVVKSRHFPSGGCLRKKKRVHKAFAVILSAAVALPAQAEVVSIRELALGTPIGSIVEVRLTSKERPHKLRGQMGMVDNEAFVLGLENSGGVSRRITFGEVRSLKLLKMVHLQPLGQGLTVEEAVQKIPKGVLVEVRLTGKQIPNKLRGRIVDNHSKGFQIQVYRSGVIDVRTVGYAEVVSIRTVDTLWRESTSAKVGRGIGTSVSILLTGALVVVIVLVVAARTGHLGG